MADRNQNHYAIESATLLSGTKQPGIEYPGDELDAKTEPLHHDSLPPHALRIVDVRYRYPQHAALNGVTWEIRGGTIGCLMGASGCGKSTLLRLIGGYLPMQQGTIALGSQILNPLSARQREFGVVFQSPELFPHLTAFENVAFPLRVRKWKNAAITKRVHECFEWVGFPQQLARRLPAQLSGGEQQRVGLARGFSFSPSVLLLDEPFSQLDRDLRDELQIRMRELQSLQSLTVVWVTHDRDDLFAVADHAAVMSGGKIIAAGTPSEFYTGSAGFAALRVACGTALNQFEIEEISESRVVLKVARMSATLNQSATSSDDARQTIASTAASVADGRLSATPSASQRLVLNAAGIPGEIRRRLRNGQLAGLRPEEIQLRSSVAFTAIERPAETGHTWRCGVVQSCRSLGRYRELRVLLENGLPLTVHTTSTIAISVNDQVEVDILADRFIWDCADTRDVTPPSGEKQ